MKFKRENYPCSGELKKKKTFLLRSSGRYVRARVSSFCTRLSFKWDNLFPGTFYIISSNSTLRSVSLCLAWLSLWHSKTKLIKGHFFFLHFLAYSRTEVYDYKKSQWEISRSINNFELLNIADQIYLIFILSMKYIFIYGSFPNHLLIKICLQPVIHSVIFVTVPRTKGTRLR